MATILNRLKQARKPATDTRSVSQRAASNLNRLYRMDRQYASAPTQVGEQEGMIPMQERLPGAVPVDPRRGNVLSVIGAYLISKRPGSTPGK